MSIQNKNLTDLTPALRIPRVMRSILCGEKARSESREVSTVDLYTVATDSFQAHLDCIEKQDRKDSQDWHLVNGLLRLAQGLQQDHAAEEERRKSFARSVEQQN
ncbi:MAG: hypothetical protein ABSB88_11575 [Bryobacteraceae bacterium]|jgi:hypothetical protein